VVKSTQRGVGGRCSKTVYRRRLAAAAGGEKNGVGVAVAREGSGAASAK
jgi:hypothetical protein